LLPGWAWALGRIVPAKRSPGWPRHGWCCHPLTLLAVSEITPIYNFRCITCRLPAVALLAGAGLAALGRALRAAAPALIVALAAPTQLGMRAPGPRRAAAAARHLVILGGYLAAGIAVTWPRSSYLADHKLPATRDAGAYVWCFWWLARQVEHLGSPWATRYLAAPVGTQLGLHVLMPLEGLVMMPVTVAFGPSASDNLLSAAMPGLLCYAAYRVARLWLPSQAGAIAAGAFFGLSSMLTWRAWYHLNLAVGAVFLPLALEAAVRLRRRPGSRQGVILGLTLAGSLLTDQESTVLAAIVVVLVLLPWLARRPGWAKVKAVTLAALVAAVAGSPQIAAVAWQVAAGGASTSMRLLAHSYTRYGTGPAGLFAPSPRVADFGLTRLGAIYYHDGVIYQMISHRHVPVSEGTPMFGLALTTLAVIGLAVSWRRRSAWLLALLWLGGAALALGPVLWIGGHTYTPAAQMLHGVRVSPVMPYTWFVQVPGLSGFREAGRLAELGLLPAALLAGAAADWLRYHAAGLLVVVAAAGFLEAGWSGNLPATVMPAAYRVGAMPTAMPALDRPIAADHSGSLVVDFPFGICGGTGTYGAQFSPEAQVLATADGHPRAVGFIARVPAWTVAGIERHTFYTGLVRIWRAAARNSPAEVAAARMDARAMNVGWVLVWPQQRILHGKRVRYWNQGVTGYLHRTGFRFAYQADGVLVYRAALPARRAVSAAPTPLSLASSWRGDGGPTR
jgi:hypothetical protein